MFNDQLKELLKKYLTGKAAVPMIPGAGATNAIAGTLLDKIRGEVGADVNAPASNLNYPPPPEGAMPPVQTPPVMPAMPPKQAPVSPIMAKPAPAMPEPVSTSPVMPSAPQSQMPSKYDDNARQQLYDRLAAQRKDTGAWAAAGSLGDMAARASGGAPTNIQQTILAQGEKQRTDELSQFEAGRKGGQEDVSANLALKKAGREETEYNESNDPNSQMSKLAVGFLKRMGGAEKMGVIPGKTTYADSVKIMPMIEKYVAAETARAAKNLTLGEKESQRREKQTQQFRDTLQKSKSYQNWQTMSGLKAQAEESVKNPSPYNDLQLIYGAVKALDPNSVVREGEIKLFQGAANIKNQLQGALSTAMKGQVLTPEQKRNVVTLITQLEQTNKNVLMQHEQPMFNQAKSLGLKMDELDASLSQPQASTAPAKGGWKVIR